MSCCPPAMQMAGGFSFSQMISRPLQPERVCHASHSLVLKAIKSAHHLASTGDWFCRQTAAAQPDKEASRGTPEEDLSNSSLVFSVGNLANLIAGALRAQPAAWTRKWRTTHPCARTVTYCPETRLQSSSTSAQTKHCCQRLHHHPM